MTFDEILDKFQNGEALDLGGGELPASEISRRILAAAADPDGAVALSLINTRINGDLVLDGIGQKGRPITLQLIACQIAGTFRSRVSVWNTLTIGGSQVGRIEIPKSRFNDCLIEGCRAGPLEARDIEVSGSLHLNGSHFEGGQDGIAAEVREARIGRSFRAIDATFNGRLSCPGGRFGSEFLIDGSSVGPANGEADIALDLAGATIDGPLGLCAREKAFRSRGSIKITAANLKALAARGAKLNGCGGPSLIADGVTVRGAVMLGGANGFKFIARGALRFILARIEGQFELADAVTVSNEDRALILDSARIEGDIVIGHPQAPVDLRNAISANSMKCGGRMMLNQVSVRATDMSDGGAVSVKGSEISGGLLVYDGTLAGCLNVDHSKLSGISLHSVTFSRVLPPVDLTGFPERYAHEADALFSAIFAEVASDIFMDEVALDGGDMRLMGANVRGMVRLSRTDIRGASSHSFISQNGKIDGGIYVAGAPGKPCQFDGIVNIIGMTAGQSVTFVFLHIGTPERVSELSLDGAEIAGDVFLDRVKVHGRFGISSASVTRNLRLYGTSLLHPEGSVMNASGASVAGSLDLAANDLDSDSCQFTMIDGNAFFDGLKAGSFEWKGLEMRPGAEIYARDMVIERVFHAGVLRASEGTRIELAGTTAAQLTDRLGDNEDGWGAGQAKLGLDGFRYERITQPSGFIENDGRLIRTWRRKWLARRAETSSTQAARQLAKTLHEQGLHEASRLILMDAFSEEGRQAPTRGLELMHWLFGLLFGHGFSGIRASLTMVALWICGNCRDGLSKR